MHVLFAELHDLLPSILPQLGADNMNTLRKLAEEGYGAGGAGGFGRGMPGGVGTIEEEDEEDDGAQNRTTCLPMYWYQCDQFWLVLKGRWVSDQR